MPENEKKRRIERLLKEFEHLSAKHAETMARMPPQKHLEYREMHVKRAEILKRRIKTLKAELNELRRSSPQQPRSRKKVRGPQQAR